MNRVLVVDDNRVNLKTVGRIFSDTDYQMEFAENAQEALDILENFQADLILLDIMMPGMDGYELCNLLKSRKETAGIMILFLSGKGTTEDRIKGYSVKADDYLTKPFNSDELLAKVNILLRLKNAQDELRATNENLEKLVEAKTRVLIKQERQAVIGQMLQGIVHNLRNPLSAIDGMALLVRHKLDGLLGKRSEDEVLASFGAKASEYLDTIRAASAQINNIIDNLLIKSRKEAMPERQAINLNDLITRELRFLESDKTIKHKISKKLNLDQTLPEIYGVYSDFSQVCSNMIKNGADAMAFSSNRELTICTSHDSDNIYIEFQDTGSGIAPEHREKIFEPFFTTKPQQGEEEDGEPTGTGLGLHTCVELMTNYNGTIKVKSKPDQGTTFILTLPLAAVAKVH